MFLFTVVEVDYVAFSEADSIRCTIKNSLLNW